MKPGLFAAVIVAVFLLGFGVGRTSAPGGNPPAQPAMGASVQMGAAQNAPVAMGEPAQPEFAGVSGTIAEVIQVPSYTYLRLTTSSGEQWAAVNTNNDLAQGQTISVVGTQMVDFTSATLKRTFPSIWFGTISGAPTASARSPMQGMGTKPVAAPAAVVPAIPKAEGPMGVRVADVFFERKALSGKTVRVKGLVTKVSAVQGINYVHVKDGSGSAATGDDDLVVMTTAQVKVDDVSTLEGRVVVDKDVGMGPRPVMLEEAKLVGN